MNTKQNIQSGKQFNKKPNQRNSPAKPDKNPDPTKLKPEENEHILLSIIFIKNSEGKYLIQKTSKEKGGHYSSTGGHVGSNEDSKTTILRELKEELGLIVNRDEIKYIGDIFLGIPIADVYYLEKDITLKDLKLQKEEVDEVSYMTKDEILNLINNENFTKSHGKILKKYF
jgi:8-oxo-dGTP pyrophosphatase MutT (NUDIX family)